MRKLLFHRLDFLPILHYLPHCRSVVVQNLKHSLGGLVQVPGMVAYGRLELLVPRRYFELLRVLPHHLRIQLDCHVQGAGGDGGVVVLEHGVVEEGEFEQVLAEEEQARVLLSPRHLHHSLEETVLGVGGNVEVESPEDLLLHQQELLLLVRIVAYQNKIHCYWGINFFVFASNEHACDTQQLQFVFPDRKTLLCSLAQEPVNY